MATHRVEDIIKLASIASGFSVARIKGKERLRDVVKVRFAIMRLSVDAGHTSSEVGRRMGRDHSTVLHGLERFAYLFSHDTKFALFASLLRKEVDAAEPFLIGYQKQEPLPLIVFPVAKIKAKPKKPSTFGSGNIRDDENESAAQYFAGIIRGSKALAAAINEARIAA